MDQSISNMKFYPTSISQQILHRPRLYEQLDDAVYQKVTVIAAPAGYGKSTAIAAWLTKRNNAYGWLSLNEEHNDLAMFFNDFLTMVKQAFCEFPINIDEGLGKIHTANVEWILTLAINELERWSEKRVILVLDDYYFVTNPIVHDALSFFITYLPTHVHLIVSSRMNPPFITQKMRARGEVKELFWHALRFTRSELSLVAPANGFDLSEEQYLEMERVTEGWIAGIQFYLTTGSNHEHVFSYLSEQVFECLPEDIRSFLLKTAILIKMNASLCQAVTGKENSAAYLHEIEQRHLFIMPLDHRKEWFRYHHSFTLFLKKEFKKLPEDQKIQVYTAAIDWLIAHESVAEAIELALSAEQYDRAIDLLDTYALSFFQKGEMIKLRTWLGKCPSDRLLQHAKIAILYGWCLNLTEQLDQTMEWMELMEKSLTEEMLVDGEPAMLHLKALRFSYAFVTRDFATCFANIKEVTELLSKGLLFIQKGMSMNTTGHSVLHGMFGGYGELKNAKKIAEFMLQEWNGEMDDYYGLMVTLLGECEYEMNHFEKARRLLKEGLQIGMKTKNCGIVVPCLLILVNMKSMTDTDEMVVPFIDQAKNFSKKWDQAQFIPVIEAFEARKRMQRNDYDNVLKWIKHNRPLLEGPFDLSRAYEGMTFIKALCFIGKKGQAWQLLKKVMPKLIAYKRYRELIEAYHLKALYYAEKGEEDRAFSALHESFTIGGEHGYVRLYLVEKSAFFVLVERFIHVKKYMFSSAVYAKKILEHYTSHRARQSNETCDNTLAKLSKQEKIITELITKGMTNKQISEHLGISYETVKKHSKNIYRKLNVNSRLEVSELMRGQN